MVEQFRRPLHLTGMIVLPRTRQSAPADTFTVRSVLAFLFSARLIIPVLFAAFAIWAGLSALPSLQAVSDGAAIVDSVASLEHGEWVVRPAWAAALPGIALGLIGLLGAAWAYHQFQLPAPDLPHD